LLLDTYPSPNFTDYYCAGFANEAVDALKATEDYSKVKLKAGHTQKAVKEVAGGREQLHDTILVQIKGKHLLHQILSSRTLS
jgi:hypothetical protein